METVCHIVIVAYVATDSVLWKILTVDLSVAFDIVNILSFLKLFFFGFQDTTIS